MFAQFLPRNALKNLLHDKKGPLWRMKGSLKMTYYDACMREKNKYVVGLGALFVLVAWWRLTAVPLVPKGDPYLLEAIPTVEGAH